jgi:hypothetical protein
MCLAAQFFDSTRLIYFANTCHKEDGPLELTDLLKGTPSRSGRGQGMGPPSPPHT